jgi:hypothetical protein
MKAETTHWPLLRHGQGIAHEVDAAALQGGGEDLGYGRFDVLVSVKTTG